MERTPRRNPPLLVLDPSTGIAQRYVGKRRDAKVQLEPGESFVTAADALDEFRRRGVASIPQEAVPA